MKPGGMSVTYSGFFTFRVRDHCQEDLIFQHVDSPMAYQLDIERLLKFEITKLGCPNRSTHVFSRKTSLLLDERELLKFILLPTQGHVLETHSKS
jgi:hypothetical protein